jgi:hypothetical protein
MKCLDSPPDRAGHAPAHRSPRPHPGGEAHRGRPEGDLRPRRLPDPRRHLRDAVERGDRRPALLEELPGLHHVQDGLRHERGAAPVAPAVDPAPPDPLGSRPSSSRPGRRSRRRPRTRPPDPGSRRGRPAGERPRPKPKKTSTPITVEAIGSSTSSRPAACRDGNSSASARPWRPPSPCPRRRRNPSPPRWPPRSPVPAVRCGLPRASRVARADFEIAAHTRGQLTQTSLFDGDGAGRVAFRQLERGRRGSPGAADAIERGRATWRRESRPQRSAAPGGRCILCPPRIPDRRARRALRPST